MGTTDDAPDLTITMLDITRIRPTADRDEHDRPRVFVGEGSHAFELTGGSSHSENIAGARRLIDELFLYMQLEKTAELRDAHLRNRSAERDAQPDVAHRGAVASIDNPIIG